MSIRIFEEIYTLNRTRNEQILLQVKAINSTLNAAGISPIYLKGTGNLIDGIYNDIGERIIGDIDFLVPENDFLTTAECFKMRECREHQFKHHNFNKNRVEDETVWLNRNQIAILFDRDVKTIGKHIANVLKEELRSFSLSQILRQLHLMARYIRLSIIV